MILVDEYAALPALAGRPHLSLAGEVLALSYSRAYRLTRALLDPDPDGYRPEVASLGWSRR